MPDTVEQVSHTLRSSQMLRLLVVGFLALLLQIPILMIGGLVSERQGRRQEAVDEVGSKWGQAQAISGPVLVLPYVHRWTETGTGGQRTVHTQGRIAILLPDRLQIDGALTSEVRHRGIFSVPVYRLAARLEGEFAQPDLQELGIDPAAVDWERAHLAVGISDARAIQEEATVTWNGEAASFLPGTGGFGEDSKGIHAPVRVTPAGGRYAFSLPLSLNGSLSAQFAPFGRTTSVELRSNHAHPSFQGAWLPTSHDVSSTGFTASWSVPFLGRNFPQAWTSETPMKNPIEHSRFGVNLVDPVDHYRMADRSVKYAGLFILLTFATVWLIEVLAGVRVHPIQYLLLGGALCLFYLLELSLSEHIGFPAAYALATVAVIGMVGAYSVGILHRVSRGMLVGGGVALLYAYLYVLLMNEDYALLIGSIGLFAALAAIMYVTRRVDWYNVGARNSPQPPDLP
jgi:inner membrane protein